MCNLFLVQTPFQLFNAVEAKNRFHQDQNNILILINKGNLKNYHQMKMILEYDNEWFEVIEIDFFFSLQKLFYPIQVKPLIAKLNGYGVETIYVALYRNIAAHIINSVKYKQVTLFDDGNSILKTVEFLDKKRKKSFAFSRKVILTILGRKTDIEFIYESTIFTLFDISSFKHIINRVIQNDFSYFKSKIKNLKREENVYFIGSRMIENGISQDIFETSLKQVVSFYEKEQIQLFYVPHRYEDIQYLENLSKKLHFILTPFASIIEFEFIMKGIDPSEVATFRSTAVDTLKIIYNPEVRIFKIGLDKIEKTKQDEFMLVYRNFANKKYKIESII